MITYFKVHYGWKILIVCYCFAKFGGHRYCDRSKLWRIRLWLKKWPAFHNDMKFLFKVITQESSQAEESCQISILHLNLFYIKILGKYLPGSLFFTKCNMFAFLTSILKNNFNKFKNSKMPDFPLSTFKKELPEKIQNVYISKRRCLLSLYIFWKKFLSHLISFYVLLYFQKLKKTFIIFKNSFIKTNIF